MIEVLVAIVLISFGILGLVSLQARAAQYSVSAEDSQRAALLAGEIATTMWGANTVSLPMLPWSQPGRRASPTPAVAGLPNATGSIEVDASARLRASPCSGGPTMRRLGRKAATSPMS